MGDSCFSCQVAEKHPATTLRGPAGCLGCQARALALSYGGMAPDIVTPILYKTWTDTKTFSDGRKLFWWWHKQIEEAKERK